MGGKLTINGQVKRYYACQVSKDDEQIFGITAGAPGGQQLWECRAVLIGIDIWSSDWTQDRIILKVRGDNVGTLTMLIKMRPSSPKLAIVARELALRLVELSFPFDAEHTPGVAHVVADRVSRVFTPGGGGTVHNGLHPALANAIQTTVPTRNKSWYRAYAVEPA